MTTSEMFSWAPSLAIALGLLAGVGSMRSCRVVVVLFATAMFVQLVGWPILFVVGERLTEGWHGNWQANLGAGYFLAVLIAFPYTTIGAVIAATLVEIVRWTCAKRTRRHSTAIKSLR